MPSDRRRVRDLGVSIGRFEPGARNALVDVPGVLVGHRTLIRDEPVVRTGVTAVLPHGGNVYAEKVIGACHVINGYGKAAGLTQLAELGTVESPILVTGTLSVGPVWEGGLRHVLDRNPEAGRRDTVNVIVAECFDGHLSDARGLHVRAEHAMEAIDAASGDEVAEGSVGAGAGTTCFGFKAGVGTSSRVVEGGRVLGVLVVANYGRRADLHLLTGRRAEDGGEASGGSVVVVLATDAPMSERQLGRLAKRATFGLARAGSFAANPSGDYVVAFSTAQLVPHRSEAAHEELRFLRDDGRPMRELFEAAGEATHEAVLNSLSVADAMDGRDGSRIEALPYDLLPR